MPSSPVGVCPLAACLSHRVHLAFFQILVETMSESSVVDCLGGFGQDFSVGCRSVLYSQNDKRFCGTAADDDDTVSSWFEVRNADHHSLVISVGGVVAEIHPCGTPFSVNRKSPRFCLVFKTVGYIISYIFDVIEMCKWLHFLWSACIFIPKNIY